MTYSTPPFLQKLGSTDSVRTPVGHYRTESLFLELWRPLETQRPIYSLHREDKPDPREPTRTVYSFQKRYIDLGDPTGYLAAMELLGSWRHWEKIKDKPWMTEHLARWNAEIVASLNHKGLDAIIKAAGRGDLKAAEYLIGYTQAGPPAKTPRGRPSKADVKREARALAQDNLDLEEDAKRVLGAPVTDG